MNSQKLNRRSFTRNIALAGVAAAALPLADLKEPGSGTDHLRISLNAFSFNDLLLAKKMTIDDLLDFCAKTGFEGVDLTGYYFPGYPAAPSDEYIFHIKKKAFRLGIDLGCTGVRNDFTWADPKKRAEEKKQIGRASCRERV